jgi:predicted enzyme related to lactoylglutathione lyase
MKRYCQHGLRLTVREGLFSLLIERTSDIKHQGIIWIGINAGNLEVAINFYEKTLGLPPVRATNDAAHFDVGSGALLKLFSGGVLLIEIGGPSDNLSWATVTDPQGNRIEVKQIADA